MAEPALLVEPEVIELDTAATQLTQEPSFQAGRPHKRARGAPSASVIDLTSEDAEGDVLPSRRRPRPARAVEQQDCTQQPGSMTVVPPPSNSRKRLWGAFDNDGAVAGGPPSRQAAWPGWGSSNASIPGSRPPLSAVLIQPRSIQPPLRSSSVGHHRVLRRDTSTVDRLAPPQAMLSMVDVPPFWDTSAAPQPLGIQPVPPAQSAALADAEDKGRSVHDHLHAMLSARRARRTGSSSPAGSRPGSSSEVPHGRPGPAGASTISSEAYRQQLSDAELAARLQEEEESKHLAEQLSQRARLNAEGPLQARLAEVPPRVLVEDLGRGVRPGAPGSRDTTSACPRVPDAWRRSRSSRPTPPSARNAWSTMAALEPLLPYSFLVEELMMPPELADPELGLPELAGPGRTRPPPPSNNNTSGRGGMGGSSNRDGDSFDEMGRSFRHMLRRHARGGLSSEMAPPGMPWAEFHRAEWGGDMPGPGSGPPSRARGGRFVGWGHSSFGLPSSYHEVLAGALRTGLPPHLLFSDRDFTADDYELLCRLDETVENRRGASQPEIDALPVELVQAQAAQPCSPSGTASEESQEVAPSKAAAQARAGRSGGGQAAVVRCNPGVGRCTICLEDWQEGHLLRRLPCNHHFHKDCVDVWLKQKACCPICQAGLRKGV